MDGYKCPQDFFIKTTVDTARKTRTIFHEIRDDILIKAIYDHAFDEIQLFGSNEKFNMRKEIRKAINDLEPRKDNTKIIYNTQVA